MDLLPSSEQEAIRRSVRSFFENEMPMGRVREVAAGDRQAVAAMWRGAGELGFFGLGLPESAGGAGFRLSEEMVLLEEAGRALAPGPWLGTILAAHALADEEEEPCRRALERILAGELRVALVEDEGGVPLELREGSLLSGERPRVADAADAEALLLLGPEGILFVPAETGAVAIEPRPSMDPTRPIARVAFRDAPCFALSSEATVAAALGRAALVLACAEALGSIDRTVEMSVAHAKTRIQFGRPIGSFQAVKHRCADMALRAEVARAATSYAVVAVRDGAPDEGFQAAAAKVLCANAFLENAADNVQNLGGMGFTWECDAQLFVKRARSFEVGLGTRRQHLDAIAASFGRG